MRFASPSLPFAAVFLALVLMCSAARQAQALPAFSDQTLGEWWKKHENPRLWPQALQTLDAELTQVHQSQAQDSFSRHPDFSSWFLTREWLRLGLTLNFPSDNPALLSAFLQLGQSPQLSHRFILSLDPEDDPAQACLIFTRLYATHPEEVKQYSNLAIAYAVVFDQPFPQNWPHHQVKATALPLDHGDPVLRFHDYVEANEAGQR
ncbi:MAG: hypothetical protein HC904_16520 [Blastochloris sp.]|nr:hypothetical protein [Blastochloris sp.]